MAVLKVMRKPKAKYALNDAVHVRKFRDCAAFVGHITFIGFNGSNGMFFHIRHPDGREFHRHERELYELKS